MFTINGIIWKVQRIPYQHPLLLMPDGEYAIGVCDRYHKIIGISSKLRGGQFKEVLCHEIVHAAMYSYNVIFDVETEELIANIVAKYGHEIISVTEQMFKRFKREPW